MLKATINTNRTFLVNTFLAISFQKIMIQQLKSLAGNSLLAALLLQCISMDVLAQRKTGRSPNVDVYMGSAIKRTSNDKSVDQFVMANDNGFITHSYYMGEDIYTVYDTTLQPISTVKVDRLHSEKTFTHKGFIRLKDKSLLLTAKTLNFDKANAIYLTKFNPESLSFNEAVEITRAEGNGFYEDFSQANLNYAVSEDKSKFVVYYKKARRKYGSEDLVQRFGFVAYDSELNKLFEQNVEFKSADGNYLLGGSTWDAEPDQSPIAIANNGTVFLWGRTDKGDGYENEYRYHVKLSKITKDGHEMIDLSGDQSKKLRDWTIQGTETGMMMATSYMEWENKTKSFLAKSDGLAFVSWSGAVKQRPVFKFIEFDPAYMSLHQSKGITKRVGRDEANGAAGAFEDNFNVNGFRILGGDDYLVLAEARHDSTKFDPSLELNERLQKNATTYTRGDVQLFSINAKTGLLNWSTRIPKDQQNRTGDGLGYVAEVLGSKIYVLFNDHFDNIEKDWDSTKGVDRFTKMDNPVVLQVIDIEDPRKAARREKLWTSEKTEGYFEPANFFKTKDNEAVLYIDGESVKERFVRMIFK